MVMAGHANEWRNGGGLRNNGVILMEIEGVNGEIKEMK